MTRYYDDFEDEFEVTTEEEPIWGNGGLLVIGAVLVVLVLLVLLFTKLTGFATTEPIARVVDLPPAHVDEVIAGDTANRVPAWWSPGGEYAGQIDLAWYTIQDGIDPVYVQVCTGDSCPWVLRTDAKVPFVEPTNIPMPTDTPYTAPAVYGAPTDEPVMPCAEIIVDGVNLGDACAWTPEERMEIADTVRLQHDHERSVQVIYEGGDPLPTPVPTRQPLVSEEEDTPLLQDAD